MAAPTHLPDDCDFPRLARRRALSALAAACLLPLAGGPRVARADSIPVDYAELRVEEGEVLLTASFGLTINPTLEEALVNGVPLYFVLEFELTRPRRFWLDEKVAQASFTYRVAWAPFTRQYKVSTGLYAQSFEQLNEVERFVGRVTKRPVAQEKELVKGTRHEAAVRLRLDINQLPKPFQVNALASREWQLASEWFRWNFLP